MSRQLQIISVEEWRDIPQMQGYQASSLGEIRSVSREVLWKFGVRKRKGRILKPYINQRGYPEVRITIGPYRQISQVVHKLIMRAFSDKPFPKAQVNHINGIKTDNRLENLEWCTQSENQLHAWRIGLKRDLTGDKNPNAKIKPDDVKFIRENYSRKSLNQKKLADMFGISQTHVSLILKNKTWQEN